MRILAAIAWCLLGEVWAPAAGEPQAATPVVTVEVTVLTRDGRPVPGLTAADFEIKLDGRVEPVRDVAHVQVSEKMTGAVGPSFDAVTAAASWVYRLVVAAPPNAEPGREFSLTAGVRKAGVSVLTNERAVAAIPGTTAAPATSPRPPAKPPLSIDERIGPFKARGLRRFTTAPGAGPRRLTGEDVPSGAIALSVVLELYPVPDAAVPADVVVKIDLLAAGDQTPVIERVVTPEPRDAMLVAEAEFPLDRLAAGAYSLRATVLSGTTVLGTTSATFAKR